MREKTKTELMADVLRDADAVMSALDQAASSYGAGLRRLFAEQYRAIEKLRDEELEDWNREASCGLHDVRRMLYRCKNAKLPYHDVSTDGKCDIYTPNYEFRSGIMLNVCDTCKKEATK